tara:strand:+ start:1368 stop:2270 length:903 start_codon:yes stop_codon:yes gene_type:complete
LNQLLSILCITYNHDKFIGEAIESWLEQKTDFQIEIIIGDDCSTDKTVYEVKKHLKIHNNIKLIERAKNIGFINNFIETYKQCNGKYIAICEGDDYWIDKNKLQMQVDFLENNNNYVLTHTNVFTLNNEKKLCQLKPDSYNYENNIYNKNEISTLTAVFRNFNIDFSEKWSQFMMADWPLWITLSEKGRFKYFDKKTGVYRINETGIWQNGWKDKIGSERLLNEVAVLDFFLKKDSYNNNFIRMAIIHRLVNVAQFFNKVKSYKLNINKQNLYYAFKSKELFKELIVSFFIYPFQKIFSK